MTEHEREVERQAEHERAPVREPETALPTEPQSEHEREVAREADHEQSSEGAGDAEIPGTIDVQPEDPRTPGHESPEPID